MSMSCPKGHALPHDTERGQCTPIYCADNTAKVSAAPLTKNGRPRSDKKRLTKIQTAEVVAVLTGSTSIEDAARTAANEQLAVHAGKLIARQTFLKVPQGLTDAAAEEWADKKLINLLPDAIAEAEYRLKLGDDDQRWSAAKQILESTGRGKKEAMNGGASPLVIINMGAGSKLPWSTKPVGGELVEGGVVNEKK